MNMDKITLVIPSKSEIEKLNPYPPHSISDDDYISFIFWLKHEVSDETKRYRFFRHFIDVYEWENV